jgi:hypothetical protein
MELARHEADGLLANDAGGAFVNLATLHHGDKC